MIVLIFFIISFVLIIMSIKSLLSGNTFSSHLFFAISALLFILSVIQICYMDSAGNYSSETDNSVRTHIIRQGQYDMIVLGKLSDETILKQQEYNENVSALLKYKNNAIIKYNNLIYDISFDRSYISDNEFAVDNLTDESKENLREYIFNEFQK